MKKIFFASILLLTVTSTLLPACPPWPPVPTKQPSLSQMHKLRDSNECPPWPPVPTKQPSVIAG